MTATAFTVRHRTIAGSIDSPITDLAADTHVRTVAPVIVTTAHYHGAGDNRRAVLGLTNDQGVTIVATIDADHLAMIPPFFLTRGARLEIGGLVQRPTDRLVTLAVYGIAPA
jgi:hypothetical protein